MQQRDLLAINSIRTLSMDAVQQANSGHPGTPMALAPLTHMLWTRFLQYQPQAPGWWNRDRFILSCGHASMLLYSQLHLAGYDVSIDDLKKFRQWGSKTPGHPEYGHTAGVETTTGPLGQGFANAVGLALAEQHMAATFNQADIKLFDHFTYVLAGDGDIMEGVCQEAASIAGHLGLGRLIAFYDDNKITIDGSTDITFTENVAQRFEAYGWHVQRVRDVNDLAALEAATKSAQAEKNKPSLIIVNSVIGFGSPNKAGKSVAHGSPLGNDEIALVKQGYQWEHQSFAVPAEVYQNYVARAAELKTSYEAWQVQWKNYQEKYPEQACELQRRMNKALPSEWKKTLPEFQVGEKLATRQASSKIMQALAKSLPELIGGSADLACSNDTYLKGIADFQKNSPHGRNVHFGIREHAMGAITNGLSLYGGLLPFAATFLIFTDYMRPSIRLAALMNLPTRYVMTHDSIGLGEDGPTHQPIEQLMTLRMIPNLTVLRPADAKETLAAWAFAAEHREGPVLLSLTRQALPVFAESKVGEVTKGAYIFQDAQNGKASYVLLATGSEVEIAFNAWKMLTEQGIHGRVVSMPSWELFAKQPQSYKDTVLPPALKARVSIEAGVTLGWQKYVGDKGIALGLDHFGASAPAPTLYKEFGLTKENVVEVVKKLIA